MRSSSRAATPASFVAFDLLAVDGEDLRDRPQAERRRALESLLAYARPPLHLTPVTRDVAVAADWLQRFEGAGLEYDHMQRDRFRHATIFQRWRPDKRPRDCGYDQLEVVPPVELSEVFARPRR